MAKHAMGEECKWTHNGQQQRLTDRGIVHMGVRPYYTTLGRFLRVDPIEGGCANDYTYVSGDPLNSSALSGYIECPEWLRTASNVLGVGDLCRSSDEAKKLFLGEAAEGCCLEYSQV